MFEKKTQNHFEVSFWNFEIVLFLGEYLKGISLISTNLKHQIKASKFVGKGVLYWNLIDVAHYTSVCVIIVYGLCGISLWALH